ncbi:hypothetical protein EDD15DRAFT_868283 [Pisolithus albus]|nr:hypothetical protein EDD15DRAFT_868283 [Pisolithus albus]
MWDSMVTERFLSYCENHRFPGSEPFSPAVLDTPPWDRGGLQTLVSRLQFGATQEVLLRAIYYPRFSDALQFHIIALSFAILKISLYICPFVILQKSQDRCWKFMFHRIMLWSRWHRQAMKNADGTHVPTISRLGEGSVREAEHSASSILVWSVTITTHRAILQ